MKKYLKNIYRVLSVLCVIVGLIASLCLSATALVDVAYAATSEEEAEKIYSTADKTLEIMVDVFSMGIYINAFLLFPMLAISIGTFLSRKQYERNQKKQRLILELSGRIEYLRRAIPVPFCTKCNIELTPGTKFCKFCGAATEVKKAMITETVATDTDVVTVVDVDIVEDVSTVVEADIVEIADADIVVDVDETSDEE